MPHKPEYSSKIQHLFGKVNIYDGVSSFFESVEDVPHPLLLLYAAHFCLSELHNGGFLQLFWNSTGVLVPEAVDGYTAIGMPKLAAIFASAAAHLGSPFPRGRQQRWDALLRASLYTDAELELVFRQAKNLYHGYAEATAKLPFDTLEREVWELADSEGGGFQERAVTYAATVEPENGTAR
jgi:hypothetical protein